MAEATFPHLGSNPAPGSPPEIAALKTKLTTSATSLGTAWRLVDELLSNSATWRGEAATAFREALSDDLPRHLKNAHTSLSKAATRLGTWHDSLVGYQETARRYESQAALDAKALSRAEATWRTAPEAELKAAEESLTRAREALDHVRRKARELEETHRVEAGKVAKSLNEATDRLAPKEPGWLDKTLKWIDEDLGDILSDISAIAGFAALLAGALLPPLGLVLMFVAIGASMGAFTLHLSDAKVRQSISDGFTKGKLDAAFFDNTVTLAGDALGALPGVGAIAAGAKSGVTTFRAATGAAGAGTLSRAGSGVRAFTDASKSSVDDMRNIENPFGSWALSSASPEVQRAVKYGVPATGAVTASSHYVVEEDGAAAQTATAADGTRIVVEDGPTAWSRTQHIIDSLTR